MLCVAQPVYNGPCTGITNLRRRRRCPSLPRQSLVLSKRPFMFLRHLFSEILSQEVFCGPCPFHDIQHPLALIRVQHSLVCSLEDLLHPCHLQSVPVKAIKTIAATSVSASTGTWLLRHASFAYSSDPNRLLPAHGLFAARVPDTYSAVVLDRCDEPVRHHTRDRLGRSEQSLEVVLQV